MERREEPRLLPPKPVFGAEDYGNESFGPGSWMVGPHRNICICPQETWYWDSGNVTEVVMSGVRCTGTELSLDQCAHHGTHIACKKTDTRFTAGVICSESEWRASWGREVLGRPFL